MRFCKLLSTRLVTTAFLAVLGYSAAAKATVIPITVTNGGFETLTVAGVSNQLGLHTSGTTTIQNATGWTNGTTNGAANGTLGYNFVFSGSTESGNNYGSAYNGGGQISLWGVENSVSNGIASSPLGGNFLAMDGAYQQATVSQILNGLTVGMDTQVAFYYAGAQQSGFTGMTTEGFTVSLSNGMSTESHNTAILSNDSHGFTGWHYTELDFTPTSTTETLSFLALGTPTGQPPFSLLDGISVVQVTPEPSSLALMGTGVLSVCGLLRRRYAKR